MRILKTLCVLSALVVLAACQTTDQSGASYRLSLVTSEQQYYAALPPGSPLPREVMTTLGEWRNDRWQGGRLETSVRSYDDETDCKQSYDLDVYVCVRMDVNRALFAGNDTGLRCTVREPSWMHPHRWWYDCRRAEYPRYHRPRDWTVRLPRHQPRVVIY